MNALVGAVNDTGLHEVNDTIGKHLGVDAKALMVAEGTQHSVGDCANAHLERSPVVY